MFCVNIYHYDKAQGQHIASGSSDLATWSYSIHLVSLQHAVYFHTLTDLQPSPGSATDPSPAHLLGTKMQLFQSWTHHLLSNPAPSPISVAQQVAVLIGFSNQNLHVQHFPLVHKPHLSTTNAITSFFFFSFWVHNFSHLPSLQPYLPCHLTLGLVL